MAKASLAVLGSFRLQMDTGEPIPLATKKTAALLAYLALHAPEAQARSKLAALLWGDHDEPQARDSLRQSLSLLRKALSHAGPGALTAHEDTISLAPAALETDARAFENLIAKPEAEDLERAMGLYRGEFLDGFHVSAPEFESWAAAERQRFRELALEGMAKLLDHHLSAGAIERGIHIATRLLAADPLQERVHRSLMELYARQGRQGAALRQYRTCAELLSRELGIEPDAQTKTLHRQLLREWNRTQPRVSVAGRSVREGPGSGLADDLGATRGLNKSISPSLHANAAPGNLPVQTTSFLGRDRDLAKASGILSGARLVTLTGPGGIGKTRLALQLAATMHDNYPDGTWLVELAAFDDPNATGHAVADVFGITQQAGKTIEQSVANALAGRSLLLILDNCEHLIDAIAGLAREILSTCPHVSLLATSRETLMVDGERTYPVRPLECGDGIDAPAVELFVERARFVEPHFELNGDADTICEICRRLDGIPLAIELAAARTRAMSPTQIRDRLHERFRLLTSGSRHVLKRHQTLRHAVEWSYDLLSSSEQAVLSRASVFSGGFGLEAAERICSGGDIAAADVLYLLDSLVRKSLLSAKRVGNTIRYSQLETIRQFAEERLAMLVEIEVVRGRHAQFFAEDAEAHHRIWRSPQQLMAYAWLDQEVDNLRAAFRWACSQDDIDVAARIASRVPSMAVLRVRSEPLNWPTEIVDAARRVGHRRLGALLTYAAKRAWNLGRVQEATLYAEEAIGLIGNANFDPPVWAFAVLAMIASRQGNAESAVKFARAGAEHPADRRERQCLATLPFYLAMAGAHDEAMAIADDIVDKVAAARTPSSLIAALFSKGRAFSKANPGRALDAFETALAHARTSGNRYWEIVIIPAVAELQVRSGDPGKTLRTLPRMLEIWGQSTEIGLATLTLATLILLFERLGHPAVAATLSGALSQMIPSTSFFQELPDTLARVRHVLGDSSFEKAKARGAAMTHREMVDYAADRVENALSTLGASTAKHQH
ncbi:adenylate/guanylate cyclase domain-containing protein [Bradyrhizobium sp. 138]|uniref:AfsR/SARP family transcriptional regulator n=1 Tax=Bradyrhizobium sp. 138 TaxID=2782615 RepID=UPI001FF883BE|nr:BTAD domain-containing putative transcriptional regulator [Bradyrhizobium sp. 138]MCK1738792.1 adenylate/guanylate cyclase domain-containing protein [Bradyrhizobium sp. 138]